jgi:hypothetical protein
VGAGSHRLADRARRQSRKFRTRERGVISIAKLPL